MSQEITYYNLKEAWTLEVILAINFILTNFDQNLSSRSISINRP